MDLLPTPNARDWKGSQATSAEQWEAMKDARDAPGGPCGQGNLPTAVMVLAQALLPTPTASLGGNRGTPSSATARLRHDEQGKRCLDDAVALLPTPTASDHKDGRNFRRDGTAYDETGRRAFPTLTDAINPSQWGRYAAAIAHHEALVGRPAPVPTDDRARLDGRFVEWMMGLPDGWVTGLVDRRPALKLLGNGVVTAQAVAGITTALDLLDASCAPGV